MKKKEKAGVLLLINYLISFIQFVFSITSMEVVDLYRIRVDFLLFSVRKKSPRARREGLEGPIRPAGRSLETPVLELPKKTTQYSIKIISFENILLFVFVASK